MDSNAHRIGGCMEHFGYFSIRKSTTFETFDFYTLFGFFNIF